MKKLLAVRSLLVFAAFILCFAASSVNVPATLPAASDSPIQADGSPLPLPVPHMAGSPTLSADGSPLPLPVPHRMQNDGPTLVADGSPLPLPVPHAVLDSSAVLIADGSPLPLPVPHVVGLYRG